MISYRLLYVTEVRDGVSSEHHYAAQLLGFVDLEKTKGSESASSTSSTDEVGDDDSIQMLAFVKYHVSVLTRHERANPARRGKT